METVTEEAALPACNLDKVDVIPTANDNENISSAEPLDIVDNNKNVNTGAMSDLTVPDPNININAPDLNTTTAESTKSVMAEVQSAPVIKNMKDVDKVTEKLRIKNVDISDIDAQIQQVHQQLQQVDEHVQQIPDYIQLHSENEKVLENTVQLKDNQQQAEQISTEVVEEVQPAEQDSVEEVHVEEHFGEQVILGEHGDEMNSSSEIVDYVESEKEEIQEMQELIDASQDEEETVVVVTASDSGPKEIVLRTGEGGEETVTVQQVTDASGQIYLLETMENVIVMESDEQSEDVSYMEMQETHQRVQKPVPSHVLGRNIINPSVDPFRNGKAPPKPRLGVKIPYRNLTSQIVSKQEIADEILERSRRNIKDTAGGQNLFAKKLTQTLAKKLAPPKLNSKKNEKALNNSDLLAILEGDDGEVEAEPEIPIPIEEVKVPMTKELEREIALKQLSELPDDPPEDKSKADIKPVIAEPVKPVEEPVRKLKPKPKREIEEEAMIHEDDILKLPRFSSNMPLKTYTRKRKPSDDNSQSGDKSPSVQTNNGGGESTKKIDLPSNSNSYMTKSSRIIKKKIIWDPDEVTPRKQMKANLDSPHSKDTKKDSSPDKKIERRDSTKSDKQLPVIKSEKKTDSPKVNHKESPKIVPKEIQKSDKKSSDSPPKKIEKKSDKMEKKFDSRVERKAEPLSKKTPAKMKGEPSTSHEKEDLQNSARPKKRKLTEVDKLLMDEGAVNMLYSFKTEEDQVKKKTNKSLKSKTNELLNDLQTSYGNVSPKALRKKESTPTNTKPKKTSPTPSTITARQKSRDSNRSSIHSPPASPMCGADASRIIRRHSSSSYSSMEEADNEDEETEKPKVKKGIKKKSGEKSYLETVTKKSKLSTEKVDEMKGEKVKEDKSKEFNKLLQNDAEQLVKFDKYKTVKVQKLGQLVQIIMQPNNNNEVVLNIENLQDLVAILKDLETECECNVVVITADGSSFCNGLNYKALIAHKEITRKNLAKKLATNVRDFLLALANFPKVLVAGVHSDAVGLGVTMLPLFDMVIASDVATFSTPYSSMGCIAEGGSLFCLSHLSQNVLISELLFRSQKLTSADALQLGLISRTIAPEKYEDELLSSLKNIADQSAQFMEATKKQMRYGMIPDITASLNSETETLVQQWIGTECQKNFTLKYTN